MISNSRRRTQSGSALMVVLVMAAIIAIMLYRELPVATFEAQRQKEQLLIDRGNEYSRGVQLYVRKLQNFPPSLEALENTNRMRFLRSRYVDPFTGKADWRILHAGPGGMITDSKLKKTSTLTGASGSAGGSSGLGAPSTVTNPFANSFNSADPLGQQGGAGNNFPQRPPAIAASGSGGSGGGTGGSSDPLAAMMQNGQQSVDPQTMAAAMQNQGTDPANQGGATAQPIPYPGYPGPPQDPSNPTASNSGTFPTGGVGGPGRFRGNPTGNSFAPGQYGGNGTNLVTSDPSAALSDQQMMQQQLGNGNPAPIIQNGSGSGTGTGTGSGTTSGGSAFGTTSAGSGLGTMNPNQAGGGIAGVASKSAGKTIKIVNDQTDRSLWEFVYDMQKEKMANAPGGGTAAGGTGTTGTGQSSTYPPSQQSPQSPN